jgi:septation ring formation regulator
MKNNWIIIVVLAIIIFAAILYLIGYFARKKNQQRLDALEERKEALFDLPIFEEIDDIKKNAYGRTKSKTHSENGTNAG